MMDHEFETYADIDGERGPVVVSYDLDGYKPIGLWVSTLDDVDITIQIPESEYDRLYELACKKAAENLACAAENHFEGER